MSLGLQRKVEASEQQQGIIINRFVLITNFLPARYREVHSDKPNKNWATAVEYYEDARRLVPDSGNPYNQLAVIATYYHDDFGSVYYYFRR